MARVKSPEKVIHQQVCDYLKLQYPYVYFQSDASGMRVTMGLRKELKKKRSNHKILDLAILHPSPCGTYHGLVIEVKVKVEDVFKKDGTLKKDEHLEEQQKSIDHLNKAGYKAAFGCGFDHCKNIIDKYFGK